MLVSDSVVHYGLDGKNTLAKHLGKRLRPAALDGSQERHPAIATGLTNLDATDPTEFFILIVPFGAIFRDKLEKISLWSLVRSRQVSSETAPFGSEFSESLVQVSGIYSRYSLSTVSPLLLHHELVGRPRNTSAGR
jgi:hypothetical protein